MSVFDQIFRGKKQPSAPKRQGGRERLLELAALPEDRLQEHAQELIALLGDEPIRLEGLAQVVTLRDRLRRAVSEIGLRAQEAQAAQVRADELELEAVRVANELRELKRAAMVARKRANALARAPQALEAVEGQLAAFVRDGTWPRLDTTTTTPLEWESEKRRESHGAGAPPIRAKDLLKQVPQGTPPGLSFSSTASHVVRGCP